MLTPYEQQVIVVSGVLLLLIFSGRVKIELAALLTLLTLSFTGLVTSQQALAGFSSPVVITLIGLFIITRGLEETGVIHWIGARLNQIGQSAESKLITLFMAAGAALSLIMNNVAAGAVLLPAAVRVAQISQVRVSKLLIPLSFGTLVGGMATYLTTANIVMSGLLQARGLDGLNMGDFIPTGGLIVLAGLVYMLLIGRRLLPEREPLTKAWISSDLQRTYQLEERMWELRIRPDSRIANATLDASAIGAELGLTVLAIARRRRVFFNPTPDQILLPGDVLLVLGRSERVESLIGWGLDLQADGSDASQRYEADIDLVEVIIPPRSSAIGQTLTQMRFRDRFGIHALALWREGRSYRTDVGKMPLQVGDALLVTGSADAIESLADDANYLVPASGRASRPSRPRKAPLALAITAVVLTIAIFELLPLPQMMLAGAVAMAVTGCLTMQEFYEAVEWRVIFLVAGIFPLSIAIAESGLAERVGGLLVGALAGSSPLILIGGMVLVTMLITQVIGGQVTSLLVGPVAINAALQTQISPQAMSVAVAMACSMAFLTPIAHPVNLLMMGPGGYRVADFFRVGVGITLVTLVTMLIGLALFWGLG